MILGVVVLAVISVAFNVIGPKKGYSPQIGTLVSEMIWMRMAILHSVKDMSQKDLDYLLDEKANTIAALLMHLAATDRIYQVNTFEGNSLKELPAAYKEKAQASVGESW